MNLPCPLAGDHLDHGNQVRGKCEAHGFARQGGKFLLHFRSVPVISKAIGANSFVDFGIMGGQRRFASRAGNAGLAVGNYGIEVHPIGLKKWSQSQNHTGGVATWVGNKPG